MHAGAPYTLPSGGRIARHAHAEPYATIVLSGGYEEAGDAGRYRVGPGDVLVHAAFSAHCDRIAAVRTDVVDIALPPGLSLAPRGRVSDPDAVIRIAADPRAAVAILRDQFQPADTPEEEPADRLATLLATGDAVAIGEWSAALGLVRETLSRQFRRLYGIDAAAYRAEARARQAWHLILDSPASLAEIAQASGHADQAHMTRAVRALTGHPPGAWRRVTSLQDRLARAA